MFLVIKQRDSPSIFVPGASHRLWCPRKSIPNDCTPANNDTLVKVLGRNEEKNSKTQGLVILFNRGVKN